MRRIYLDYAASAPVSTEARKAFLQALGAYGNPSSPHDEGREAGRILEAARQAIAKEAGMKREQVLFTGSATEANNLAIRGMKPAHVLFMAGAHASIAEAARACAAYGEIPFTDGRLDLETLKGLVRKETMLVSVEAVSSETGIRIDTRAVRQLLDSLRSPGEPRIFLHVDASQLPLIESFERTRLGADLITLDAQKVGGIRGIGALCVVPLVPLAPLMLGGGQERGLRSGTPSPALAAAFAAALLACARSREGFAKEAGTLRTWLTEEIKKLPKVYINEGKEQAPHILNVSFAGRDTDYLVALLNEDGFAVSTKSACETDSETGSRAVLALTGDEARSRATLRISFGPSTRTKDLVRFQNRLAARISFLDQASL